MDPRDVARAIDAALAVAADLGLQASEANVLQNSNKVALRLLPCDVFARVAPLSHEHAALEIAIARRLATAGCPVAALEPRVEPRGYARDGFEITLWTFYETTMTELPAPVYAEALGRLHAGMRTVDLALPRFTGRVDRAEEIVAIPDLSPELVDADRDLLVGTLRRLRRAIDDRAAPEQLLHGEPHPGNVLATADGPRFIDLETCCRGPVELDLAHVPEGVGALYPDVDRPLVRDCRELVLAMVAAWRWERGDQLPKGMPFGHALMRVLRAGPPWPSIDQVYGALDDH